MNYSKFGKKFTHHSGIMRLMDDLGRAVHSKNKEIVMLGGGNPQIIPAAHEIFIDELKKCIENSSIDQMLGRYDGPQGSENFIEALAEMLNTNYGWSLDRDNIIVTNGSQSSFFSLFNLFAGEMDDGTHKKVLFPLTPEYIGYADQGLSENMLVSVKPHIDVLKNQIFKYQIDFDRVKQALEQENIGVICISRPTNPTGNVITNDELFKLNAIAQAHNVPLIIDNAYGQPFPGVIYTDATLHWNENMILCMSLSKLGLPGLRAGVVIANHDTIAAMSKINAILTLAPSSVGPDLLTRLIQENELIHLVNNIIKPNYQKKADIALKVFNEVFTGCNVRLHKLEGAFFMWLWFPELEMTSEELYQRLKSKGVYVIPGEDFFIGSEDNWQHQHQCIRINYAKDEAILRKGLKAIYQEIF